MFEQLVWKDRKVSLKDMVFRLDPPRPFPDYGNRELCLVKERRMIEQYATHWRDCPRWGGNLLELGIYDGGSIAFWNELLNPAKHVAIDAADWGDSIAYQEYVIARNITDQIKTY